jgi:hypothetical protein
MNEFRLTDPTREPAPTPCPDCGRAYLNGENVTLAVPAPGGGSRVAWSGCVDCWVRRTSLVGDLVQQGREQAAVDIEKEAAEYEKQYGTTGRGGYAPGLLLEAASIARTGFTPEERPAS